uniref:Uncharacterized protein n=1 Tax=Rhizophora mucronata TaxID=61149 RepID=A0A2P2J265_RHIMU
MSKLVVDMPILPLNNFSVNFGNVECCT